MATPGFPVGGNAGCDVAHRGLAEFANGSQAYAGSGTLVQYEISEAGRAAELTEG
jgi:hypothetical protein